MRKFLFLLPAFIPAPALAQQAAVAHTQQTERVLADPTTIDRMTRTMQSLSKAFLDMPVGEVQAAVEGREATPREKKLTVRDLGQRDDKQFDRHVHEQIANARPVIEHGMKAMAQALPAITRAMDEAGRAIERAAANMPDPTYPKR